MIAMIVTRNVFRDYFTLIKLSEEKLAEWLIKEISAAKKMNYADVYRRLYTRSEPIKQQADALRKMLGG